MQMNIIYMHVHVQRSIFNRQCVSNTVRVKHPFETRTQSYTPGDLICTTGEVEVHKHTCKHTHAAAIKPFH